MHVPMLSDPVQPHHATKPYKPVLPGQVWEDCDHRMSGRRVWIEGVDDKYAYAIPEHARGREYNRARIRLLLRRMRPTATGWKLIEDVQHLGPTQPYTDDELLDVRKDAESYGIERLLATIEEDRRKLAIATTAMTAVYEDVKKGGTKNISTDSWVQFCDALSKITSPNHDAA